MYKYVGYITLYKLTRSGKTPVLPKLVIKILQLIDISKAF